jgi:ribonuclease PH
MTRHDGRHAAQLRPLTITRGFLRAATGSALIEAGGTRVLCAASIESKVPDWMAGRGRGWLTAEYNMLPASTRPRKRRERDGKVDGRTTEIQRLIGRSLRAIINLDALGERTLHVDCDVLEADGGTRTASITGAFVAVADALYNTPELRCSPLALVSDSLAAVSVGIVDGQPALDLDYHEDVDASVDMNVVMTGAGKFVEVQGTGEEATFDRQELNALLDLASTGIAQLTTLQREILRDAWPLK